MSSRALLGCNADRIPGIYSGPTSTQALAAAGYTHRSDPEHPHRSAHLIERDGRIRARLTAWEVWSWLERRGRKLAALSPGTPPPT